MFCHSIYHKCNNATTDNIWIDEEVEENLNFTAPINSILAKVLITKEINIVLFQNQLFTTAFCLNKKQNRYLCIRLEYLRLRTFLTICLLHVCCLVLQLLLNKITFVLEFRTLYESVLKVLLFNKKVS